MDEWGEEGGGIKQCANWMMTRKGRMDRGRGEWESVGGGAGGLSAALVWIWRRGRSQSHFSSPLIPPYPPRKPIEREERKGIVTMATAEQRWVTVWERGTVVLLLFVSFTHAQICFWVSQLPHVQRTPSMYCSWGYVHASVHRNQAVLGLTGLKKLGEGSGRKHKFVTPLRSCTIKALLSNTGLNC